MCQVSVIIPIYNGEKYLKKCLDSILNQTLKNIEIICINDGSTDNTGSILEKYSFNDKRIKIVTTKNNGQGSARNIGLNQAKGEYILFVDADDWIELDSLNVLYSIAKSNALDLLFFQMVNYMDNSREFVETDLYNHQCFINNGIMEDTTFNFNDTKDFLFEIPVCPVSKLYNKKFLDNNNLRFPEEFLFEDNPFFYNSYFKCSKAGFLKKQFYYRRRHENSVTQTFDEKKFDIIKAANEVLNVFLDEDMYSIYQRDVINHTFSMVCEWFKKSPLYLKQNFYKLILDTFKGFHELRNDFVNNLNEDYFLAYDCACHHEYYLDFLSEYKLNCTHYTIFDNGKEFELGSDEYNFYKSNLSSDYKISVIIPIYNNEQLIHRTLMSIENQSLGIDNIEVIMVDDSSTDNTYEILKKYSNQYNGFKVIHIKEGTGSPGTPRNIGLLESSSDYVMFLDHDDFFEINALDILYESIIESNCDFVYGTYASVDIDSPTKIIYPNEKHGYFKSISENERSIAFPPPSIWTKLFKRDFLIENNIFFPTILGEDAIFLSKALFNANEINYLWDSLICYHNLNVNSYTKNISYKYLIEGFTSEEYLYDLYGKFNDCNLYKIRGEGILDFYLTQFYKADISETEIIKLFPALYKFTNNIRLLGLSPHVNEINVELFNYIINQDIDSIILLKQIVPEISKKDRFKNIFSKIIKKVFR